MFTPSRMFRYTILLVILLIAQTTPASASAASDGLKKLCKSAASFSGCKTSIMVPTAKLKMGKINWIKWNACKNKLKYGFGWTCIGGYDKTQIEGPVGIEFGSSPVDICAFARKTIPGISDLVQKSAMMCTCLPDAMALLDQKTVTDVLGASSIGEASADVLEKFAKFGQCAIDSGLVVRNNKPGLTQNSGALVASDNVRVLQAAEIDLARYLALAGALAPCFTPAGCQPEAIRGFFEVYLKDSEALMLDQVKGMLAPWADGIKAVESSFNTLADSTKSLGTQINQIQAEAAGIINDFCPDAKTCANHTLTDFKKQVETTLDLSKQMAQVNSVIVSTVSDVKAIVSIVETAQATFASVGDLSIQGIIDKVMSGQLRKMEELAGGLKAAQQLPKIIDDLQDKLPQLQKVVASVADKGPAFVGSLQGIFTSNWLGDYEGDAATANKISDQVFNVQKLVATMIPQATQLYSSVMFLVDSVGSVATTGKIGQVDIRVASYQRWTRGSFDMPCLTTGKYTFKLGPYKETVNYPKFYRCAQKYYVPFPNHHIPFIKITLPSDSTLAKFGKGQAKGSTTSITWNSQRPVATRVAGQSASATTAAGSSSVASSISSASNGSSPSVSSAGSQSVGPSTTPSAVLSSAAAPSVPVSAQASATGARKRALSWPRSLFSRQSPDEGANDANVNEADYPIPSDLETSVAAPIPSGYVPEASSGALETSALPTTAAFYSTVINGQTTTLQTNAAPTGAPTTTEVASDPAETTLSLPTEYAIYADVPATALGTVISSWEEVGTVSVNVATPTLEAVATTGSVTTAATGTATAAVKSGATRTAAPPPAPLAAALLAVGLLVFSHW